MTDIPATARFALPLLAIAQAQKEVTHNEALTLVDALLHAAVEDDSVAVPPADAAPGTCWIAAAGATGDWSGHEGELAIRTAGGWRFVSPRPGMRALRTGDGAALRFDGGGWVAPAPVASPAGGVTIDSEARAAIAALILVLEAQGLLISA